MALGGPLGDGFAAPPVDTNDKVSIKIRISFNRDGTLMSPPHLLVPAPSEKRKPK